MISSGGGMMKRSLQGAMALLFLFLFLSPPVSSAKGPYRRHGWGQGMWKRSCVTFDDLGLSEAQRMSIKKVEVKYMDKVFSLRNRFMIKRLELRGLLRDSNAAEKAIREKAKEFRALQGILQEKIIDYQIEIRAILTAEQVRLWCTMGWFPSMRGWGRGREGR